MIVSLPPVPSPRAPGRALRRAAQVGQLAQLLQSKSGLRSLVAVATVVLLVTATGFAFSCSHMRLEDVIPDRSANVQVAAARSVPLVLAPAETNDPDKRRAKATLDLVLGGFVAGMMRIGARVQALRRSAGRSVQDLIGSMTMRNNGKANGSITVIQRDELEELTGSVDAMRRQWQATQREMELRMQGMQVLNEVSCACRSLNPQQILNRTIGVVMSALEAEAGVICIFDDDRVRLSACRGMQECLGADCPLCAAMEALVQQLRGGPELLDVADVATHDVLRRLVPNPAGKAAAAVPLPGQDRVVGMLAVFTHQGQSLADHELALLKAVGQHVGAAVHKAYLYERAGQAAATEERELLAREIHDSACQTVSYLKVKVALVDALLAQNKVDEARDSLREMRMVAGELYTDLRESIFDLRRTGVSNQDFLAALQHYIVEYKAYYGLEVQVVLVNGTRPLFRGDVELQLSRIIQEALTNVRKHARASQVWLRFQRHLDHWSITIQDDGRGFDPGQVLMENRPSFGLRIMSERATLIGSELDWESEPGKGTQLVIRVPL